MDIKNRIMRSLSQATCDKTGLNQTVLKFKRRFDEANAVINGNKKKSKK